MGKNNYLGLYDSPRIVGRLGPVLTKLNTQ